MADGIYEIFKISKLGIEFKINTGPPIDKYQLRLNFD